MSSSDDVAAYVREVYSHDGAEVESIGDDRIRVRMPPCFHNVTEFCQRLFVEFNGACVDLVVDDNNTAVIFEVFAAPRAFLRDDSGGGGVAPVRAPSATPFWPGVAQGLVTAGIALGAAAAWPSALHAGRLVLNATLAGV